MASFGDIMLQYGIFGALFVSLLVYVMKENSKRECEYQKTIKSLSEGIHNTAIDSNKVIHGVDADLDSLSEKIHVVKQDVDTIKINVEDIKRDVNLIAINIPK